MRVFWSLMRRELGGFFVSPSGYIVMAAVAGLLGLSFSYLLEALSLEDKPVDMPLTELFYSTPYFWLILLLTAPVITMRSFAHEKSTGTFETLMTAPVGDWSVVMAKFSGALAFYVVMWMPLWVCFWVAARHAPGQNLLDPRLTFSTFAGLLLVGGLYISLGCFASSLTRSQIVAAILGFMLGFSLFLTSFFSFILPPQSGWQAQLLRHVSMFEHLRDFVRGVIDVRHVVFYVSGTAWFLYMTVRVLERRRWR